MGSNNLYDLSFLNPIIVYDGQCHLCNGSMRFLFKLDKKQVIKCCTLQNEYYKDVALKGAQSVILIWKGQYFFESDAIIQALKLIGYVGVFMSAIIALFPARVRNWMYKFVAKRRYRLFGKSETCMIPEALWKNRLIQ